jgi:hypothetical protein
MAYTRSRCFNLGWSQALNRLSIAQSAASLPPYVYPTLLVHSLVITLQLLPARARRVEMPESCMWPSSAPDRQQALEVNLQAADTGLCRSAPQADLGRAVPSRPKGCFQALPRPVTPGQ